MNNGNEKPAMYGILDPQGSPYFDDFCVSPDRESIEQEVIRLNAQENDEASGVFSVTPLFTPLPSVNPFLPPGLHLDTQALVISFCKALGRKLYDAQEKHGHSNNWKRDDWQEECLIDLREHISKGDPRDVAAYCAFMWYHGWQTNNSAGTGDLDLLARKEGVCFAANHIAAAWEHGFIDAPASQVADVAGAVLAALEFLPEADPLELSKVYADSVISRIRDSEGRKHV